MIRNINLSITYKAFLKTAKYFMKALPNIKHSYNDLLVFLQLKKGEHSEDILKKAFEYSQCSEEQRHQLIEIFKNPNRGVDSFYSPENIETIQKIADESFTFKKFAEYFIESDLREVFSIIELATDKTLSEIKDFGKDKLLDLLIYIIKYPVDALQSANNYKQQFEKIEETYEFLISYNDPERKRDPIDECVNNDIKFKAWNIYDLSWLENNLITPLRKDKYSIEWLENCELEDLFISYLELNDRNTIQSGDYWYREKLREIDQKCEAEDVETGDKENPKRKRTDEEKQELAEMLSLEYFLHERLREQKINSQEDNDNE